MQSNSLIQAQKKGASAAATINEKSLKHFEAGKQSPRKGSPRKSPKPDSKPLRDDGDDDEDSGDEAEKLDEEQMNELDNIYRK